MQFKTAKCERTGHQILLGDGFFTADPATGNWSFICIDAPEMLGEYNIHITELTKSPEAFCDWIAHLNEKTWFDANKFANFFTKFRLENNLFGSL